MGYVVAGEKMTYTLQVCSYLKASVNRDGNILHTCINLYILRVSPSLLGKESFEYIHTVFVSWKPCSFRLINEIWPTSFRLGLNPQGERVKLGGISVSKSRYGHSVGS